YLGSSVFWLEGCLWLSGCTRRADWTEGPRAGRWLRLGLGLGLANVCATASALVVAAVFYRLYFGAGYVGRMLACPGSLCVLAGGWIAGGFAVALRRVARGGCRCGARATRGPTGRWWGPWIWTWHRASGCSSRAARAAASPPSCA